MSCKYQRICNAADSKAICHDQWKSLNDVANPTDLEVASLAIAKENLERAQQVVDLYESPPSATERCIGCILTIADFG